MHVLLETAQFSRPYLARYWPRFLTGILLGVIFGASNGLFMGSVYLLLNRLDDPAHVQQVTEKARQLKAEHNGNKASQESPALQSLKSRATVIKGELYILVDPWLPLKDRPLDWKQILGGGLLLPLGVILRGLLGYGSSYLLAWSGQRITNDVKRDAFRKISYLSLDFFQKTTTSELIARIENDGAGLNNFLKLGLSDLIKEPSTIVFILIGMFAIDWKFTLIALAFAPLCIIPTRVVTRKIKALSRQDFATNVGQGSITIESFQNVRITKAYALEEVHTRLFFKTAQRSAHYNMKSVQSREMLNPIVQTLNSLGISAVILYAVWTHCPYAKIFTFIVALGLFYTPFKKMSGLGVYITQLTISLERLMALFKFEPTVKDPVHPVPLTGFKHALEFKDVSFSYGDGLVLDGINFTLRRGLRLGLAGESGSGKSSLLNLLFRFYDPTSGQVIIDDLPIEMTSLADLRMHLALVSQDILLFNTTVAENIAYGKIGATREEIIVAAREAYAHDFIEALPQGYDTPLGERGQRLSGGQRQRIAIARAFVRNAPILVLDEATASLDSQAEAEVQRAIDHLAENRTVICVAHRLSTLRSMDEILVMEKGRVIERGDFDQLLAQRGAFTAMAARQSIFPKAA
jgi:ABC-type multidrug transport system fused ATPase/permease subunit